MSEPNTRPGFRVQPDVGECPTCGLRHPLSLIGDEGPERFAFTRWAASLGYNTMRFGFGGYREKETRDAWNAWQARAALPNAQVNAPLRHEEK